MKKTKTFLMLLLAALLMLLPAAGTADAKETIDYSSKENWAYDGIGQDQAADVFLVCPTVDTNGEYNMSITDEATKAAFLVALNMERGIYEPSACAKCAEGSEHPFAIK